MIIFYFLDVCVCVCIYLTDIVSLKKIKNRIEVFRVKQVVFEISLSVG